MGWYTIRKAKAEDYQALETAAVRFCKRHSIEFDTMFTAQMAIDFTLDDREDPKAKHLRPLWRRIVRRTLGHPYAEGIAYGYVGYVWKQS